MSSHHRSAQAEPGAGPTTGTTSSVRTALFIPIPSAPSGPVASECSTSSAGSNDRVTLGEFSHRSRRTQPVLLKAFEAVAHSVNGIAGELGSLVVQPVVQPVAVEVHDGLALDVTGRELAPSAGP